MNDLVVRLSRPQRIEASLRPEKTLEYFKAAVDRGYVHVMFTETGTELGVRMDPEACDLSGADWDGGTGTVHIEGGLILNYVRVRCRADIDLSTLDGEGQLEAIEEVTPAQLAKERAARAAKTI